MQHGRKLNLRVLAVIVRVVSAINSLVGNVFAWLALAMVLVCFAVVVQRYAFSTGRVWMQDLYVWLNGAMFTAVAGFALLRNDHVRVDIWYRPAKLRTKALIDLFGVLVFLLPYCWVVWVYAWPSIVRSWRYAEGSTNIGGMPGLYVLKSFVLVFAALLALQGVAMALRAVLVLAGKEDLLPQRLRYPRNDAGDEQTVSL
jgi:TRAP-type mannitol/chloroaromatic compound transport system permease small subunit